MSQPRASTLTRTLAVWRRWGWSDDVQAQALGVTPLELACWSGGRTAPPAGAWQRLDRAFMVVQAVSHLPPEQAARWWKTPNAQGQTPGSAFATVAVLADLWRDHPLPVMAAVRRSPTP